MTALRGKLDLPKQLHLDALMLKLLARDIRHLDLRQMQNQS